MQRLYREHLARRLQVGVDGVFLYWKGRVGLYALLRAMGIGAGDSVVLPAFTCVVVPNAVLYTGARPGYVDIDPRTLNPTLAEIRSAVTPATRCILIQNTFGLSSEVEEIVAFARERGIYTIEDCTHGFGGTFRGKPNGTYCDAAFFSTQWNKPFSTGLGGFALVKSTKLRKRLIKLHLEALPPTWKQRLMLDGLIRVKGALINDSSYWLLMRLYRMLSRHGLMLGSSSKQETDTPVMPEGFFRAACDVQARHGIQALKGLDARLARRQENGRRYNTFLRERGKFHYADALLEDHAFLKYPVFVRDRKRFVDAAIKARIPLGDWFCSMLHPVAGSLQPWQLDEQAFPVAREKASTILNLPTETCDADKVVDFLEAQLDGVLKC